MKKKAYILIAFLIIGGLMITCRPIKNFKGSHNKALMPYEPVDFSRLLGMKGFSDALLKTHFKLYEGYVKNTNLILKKLKDYEKSGRMDSLEYAELKRRLGFEFNGMRLHEYYFGNLGGNGKLKKDNELYEAIELNFGSFEKWKKDFAATGLMRGVGWVVLYEDLYTGRLMNVWINEHDTNHLVGCNPLIVMDMYEHAYMADYGLDRSKYIDAFFNNLDWGAVAERYGVEVAKVVEPEKRAAEAKKEKKTEVKESKKEKTRYMAEAKHESQEKKHESHEKVEHHPKKQE